MKFFNLKTSILEAKFSYQVISYHERLNELKLQYKYIGVKFVIEVLKEV